MALSRMSVCSSVYTCQTPSNLHIHDPFRNFGVLPIKFPQGLSLLEPRSFLASLLINNERFLYPLFLLAFGNLDKLLHQNQIVNVARRPLILSIKNEMTYMRFLGRHLGRTRGY